MEKQNTLQFVKARLESSLDLYGWKEIDSIQCQTYISILNECMDDESRKEFYKDLADKYKKS